MGKEADKLRKEKLLSNGICFRCGEGKLVSKTMCEACLNDCNTRHQERKKQRVENGQCTRCGGKPLKTETMCEKCNIRMATINNKRKEERLTEGLCTKCGIRPLKTEKQCQVCLQKEIDRGKSIKNKVYSQYGGYKCTCCGETEECFLSIDHINNDGAKHRKEVGTSTRFYRWIINNNFPEGFQVLCMNCQFGKRQHGICPHQTDKHSKTKQL